MANKNVLLAMRHALSQYASLLGGTELVGTTLRNKKVRPTQRQAGPSEGRSHP